MKKRQGKVKSNLHVLMGKRKIRSLNQLARETGLSRPTIDRIYHDKADRVELETMYNLCKFFDCTVGDLYTIDDED